MNERIQSVTLGDRRWLLLAPAGFLLIAALLTYVNSRFTQNAPLWSEFMTPWNAVHLWLKSGLNPYSDSVRLAAQDLLYGRPAVLSAGEQGAQFIYPLPSVLLLIPFALLPYGLARILWMTLIEISLILLVLLGVQLAGWRPSWTTLLLLSGFSLLWLPGLQAVVSADVSVFFLTLQVLVLWLFQVRRGTAAGILSAFAFSGPALMLPILVFLIYRAVREERWNFLAGWAASLVLTLALSFRFVPAWPVDWFREIVRWLMEHRNLIWPFDIQSLLNPFPFPFVVSVVVMGLITAYMLFEWRISAGKSASWQQWTTGLTMVLSLFLVLFPSISYQILLLPVLCIVFSVWHFRRGKAALLLTTVMLVVFLSFSWGMYYTSGGLVNSFAILHIPSIAALLGIWWIRWWKLNDGMSLPMDYVQLDGESR